MTQEQKERAARVLTQLKETMPYKDGGEFETTIVVEAYDIAITVLREQGWVRTSDRLPDHGMVAAKSKDYDIIQFLKWDVIGTNWVEWWFQMPTLPVN